MEYIIKSTTILTLFYIFYKLFLQNETFFQSIRSYFLVGIISSLAIPLIIITKYVKTIPLALTPQTNGIIVSQSSTILKPEIFDWLQLIISIYLLGVLFFTIRFLIQLSSVLWFLYTHPKIKKGKYVLVKTSNDISPFSFFNFIIYNENHFNPNELNQILAHEKIHTNHFHSIDIILSQCLVIVNWFNPIIWLYHKELQKNLEYIADEFDQRSAKEKKKYQYLLLKSTTPDFQMVLTNNFYNSIIKKRIVMLKKDRSKKVMQFKFILIIPILVAFIFTFNTKIVAQQVKTKNINEQSEYNVERITKDFQKKDLKNLKEELTKKGINLKFNKLKYNSKNEITGINISVKNQKGNRANLSQSSILPIKPIHIEFNNTSGTLALGNISETDLKSHKAQIERIGSNVDIRVGYELNSDPKKSIFLSDDIIVGSMVHSDPQKNIFLSNEKPLIIVDGKELENGKMEDIDSENIEVIEVLKGQSAVNKYGEKAKDGVIVVNTTVNYEIILNGNEHVLNGIPISLGKEPIYEIDGVKSAKDEAFKIKNKNIKSVTVLKGEEALNKYGEQGKNGVIVITTKKN